MSYPTAYMAKLSFAEKNIERELGDAKSDGNFLG